MLISLYNKVLQSARFTVNWKSSRLAVIPKGKSLDLSSVGAYRPISLLNSLGKVCEKLVVSRIEDAFIERGLNSSSQFGFKPKLSMLSSVKSGNKKYVVCLFVDIHSTICDGWDFR